MAGKKQVSDITEEKKIADMSVGQLKELLFKGWPPFHLLTVCVNFADIPLGTQYPMGNLLFIDQVRFGIFYTGGARITEHMVLNKPMKGLEMVENGTVMVDLPVPTNRVDLSIMSAGNEPIEIDYYNNAGLIGSATSQQHNLIERVRLTGHQIIAVSMRKAELIIFKVCYTVRV